MRKRSEELRFICPMCHREYKKYGWYRRHCLIKHQGVLPHITKKIVDGRTIDQIFFKISQLENKFDQIAQGKLLVKHDIDIKSIQPKGQIKMQSIEMVSFKECVKELRSVFDDGLKILGKMEDVEVGVKSEDALEQKALEVYNRIKQKEVVKQNGGS